jgi:hypothetical protein
MTSSLSAADSVVEVVAPLAAPLARSGSAAGGPKAKAEEYIHLFVDKPRQLIAFLEHIVQREPAQNPIVYNTMLELYLRESNDGGGDDAKGGGGGKATTAGAAAAATSEARLREELHSKIAKCLA